MLSYRTLFLPYRFDDAAFMPSLVTRPSFRSIQFGQKGIPYLNTYDCQRIRYPDPKIKANDTIRLDLESNKIVDFIMFDAGKSELKRSAVADNVSGTSSGMFIAKEKIVSCFCIVSVGLICMLYYDEKMYMLMVAGRACPVPTILLADTIVAGIEAKISTWTFFPKAPLAPTMLLSGSWCLSTIGRQRHD
ncbi:hypothetical protein V6N13_060560 [Hibiscus sabdariffa]